MLSPKMPTLEDDEGVAVPEEFPAIIDAHVHIFPAALFSSIWEWFETNAWSMRYQYATTAVLNHLFLRGVRHIVALQYAHKPSVSRMLNQYMVDKCREFPGRVTGIATVFPGEADADLILRDAFDHGLKGVKLHSHIQCLDLSSKDMNAVFELCESERKPLVIHAGREPKSPAYRCDPYDICSAKKIERVLKDFPNLKICVPHLGFDEISDYRRLVETYDNLWLDTAMVLTDYFPITHHCKLEDFRMDRILYGSDFPNIPYAWDRELKWLKASGISNKNLEMILNKNATAFFEIEHHGIGCQ